MRAKLTPVFLACCGAGYISPVRLYRSNMSMGAYFWSGGQTLRDWSRP